MNREDAKKELKRRLGPLDAYLRGRGIDIGANGKKPFRCLNPDHEDKNPSMNYLGNNVYCHACKKTYDIIDLMAMEQGITPGQFITQGYQRYNIPVEGGYQVKIGPSPIGQAKPVEPPAPQETDYSAYIDACHARIDKLDPKQLRGLSKTVRRFKLGYDPAWKSHGGRGTWEALIIPNGKHSFTVRNLDPNLDPVTDKGRRYDKSLGAHPIFNQEALEGDAPVFITEGAFDALSILEVGGEAIAMEGAATNKLLQLLEQKRPMKPVILALDKDETGARMEAALMDGLIARGIPFLQADITGDSNDANEALNGKDAAFFVKAVHSTIEGIKSEEEKGQAEAREAYRNITAAANLDAFFEEAKKGHKAYPTGLEMLDNELKGGLFEGLTIVGAISSAGKTTLAMQIADNMAKAGRDCLIFSLETSRYELMARSLSRETMLQKAGLHGIFSARDILDGITGETLEAASNAYKEYADRLYIYQSLGKIGTQRIRTEVVRHKDITGNIPVVFVDYLQLLGPNEPGRFQGAKEIMDAAVTDLKCLAVDYQTPVILISSFNRDNYGKDANMASFKESGNIEYSADLLLGLQYEAAARQGWNQEKAEEEAQKSPRKMELKIMKNRNGAWGQRIAMDYYQVANFFREMGVQKGRRK